MNIFKKPNGMNIVGQGGKIILPAVALMTLTWVYLIASLFLYVGVMIFIGTEENQLTKAFGKEYEDYVARVDRLVPLKKP
jgi:protein-S-isoprenylcysteine O-methyltransferase Ste14